MLDPQEDMQGYTARKYGSALSQAFGLVLLLGGLSIWAILSVSAEASSLPASGRESTANALESRQFLGTRAEDSQGKQISIQGHEGAVTDIDFSPNGTLLATGSTDGTIRIWDAGDGSLVRSLSGHDRGVNSIAFSPDGALIASGSDDRTARLWSVTDGSLQRILNPLMESRVVKVEFSPDGSLVAMGGNRCVVELRRVPTGILRRTIVPLGCAPGNGGSVEYWGLEFTQDGSQVVTGDGRPCCGGGILQWWETGEYTPPQVLKTGIVVVRDMALSPDGSVIALALVGLSDFWLLDATTGETIAVLPDHVFRVNDLEYSPNGSLLVSASNDTGIGLWSAADGVLLRMLKEHLMQVTTVAFSPDGLHLASGSQDGEVLIWNVKEELSR